MARGGGPQLIALVGVIGSGKDYRADILNQQGYLRVDFKDVLLDMASDLCGYDVREDYDWFKNRIIGVRRPANKFVEGIVWMDSEQMVRAHPQVMTGRRLLQRLGTEVMRKMDQDYWVKEWHKRAKPILFSGGRVVVADCRFENELREIVGFPANGYPSISHAVIFCDYHSSRYISDSPHPSEAMAQEFLKRGMRDGDEIILSEMEDIVKARCQPPFTERKLY